MHIDEFKESMIKDMDKFIANFKNENMKSPNDWPLEMNEGEWFDQFMLYITNIVE